MIINGIICQVNTGKIAQGAVFSPLKRSEHLEFPMNKVSTAGTGFCEKRLKLQGEPITAEPPADPHFPHKKCLHFLTNHIILTTIYDWSLSSQKS